MLWDRQDWWKTRWEWSNQFIIFPRQSDYSKKWLWLEPIVYGRRVITGPGTPVILEKYMTPKEYTLYLLRDKEE